MRKYYCGYRDEFTIVFQFEIVHHAPVAALIFPAIDAEIQYAVGDFYINAIVVHALFKTIGTSLHACGKVVLFVVLNSNREVASIPF